jgi:hypothetical protein
VGYVRSSQRGLSMKWMLVVLVGGVTPVQTDLFFEKLSDCLAAEVQLRKTYTDAIETSDKRRYLAASLQPPDASPWTDTCLLINPDGG